MITTGGVMDKISIASIAVAAAATGLPPKSKLFRFTVWHSVALAGIIGLLALFYAYIAPGLMPVGA